MLHICTQKQRIYCIFIVILIKNCKIVPNFDEMLNYKSENKANIINIITHFITFIVNLLKNNTNFKHNFYNTNS